MIPAKSLYRIGLLLLLGVSRPCFTVAQHLEEVIQWTDSLRLEEPPGIFTVSPHVTFDTNRDFIVTDYSEAQVRLYDRSGRLRLHFGSKGEGPGEFKNPMGTIRLLTGQLFVFEFSGTLSLFDERGTFIKRFPRVLPKILGIHNLPQGGVLVEGPLRPSLGASPLLHRINPDTGQIEHSFFPHPIPIGTYGNILNGLGEIITADVQGDQIVAAFAPMNRLYIFNLDGTLDREIEIPFQHFRTIHSPGKKELSSKEIFDALQGFSTIHKVFWLNDGSFLIQYRDVLDWRTGDMRWNLAHVSNRGTLLFDIPNTPQLFTVDKKTSDMFFSHPASLSEEHWIVGNTR